MSFSTFAIITKWILIEEIFRMHVQFEHTGFERGFMMCMIFLFIEIDMEEFHDESSMFTLLVVHRLLRRIYQMYLCMYMEDLSQVRDVDN